MKSFVVVAALLSLVGADPAPIVTARAGAPADTHERIQCANLVYAGTKSSVCFSDKFLKTLDEETNIDADAGFTPVKLRSEDLYQYPFAVMTGEGDFALLEDERRNLKAYLTRGGFLLASAGCSSPEWNRSFRREFKKIFPEAELKKIEMEHALFKTVFDIPSVRLKRHGTTLLEGFEIDGKIVLIYTAEGLNDTGNVKGCCCCGGNEVKNSREINTNILAYALTH